MDIQKKITLVPIAGLCNRMNAITSGLKYKHHNPECELSILWWKTHDCCADFVDLFENIPGVNIRKMNSILKNRPATPRTLFIPRFFRNLFYDFEMTFKHKAADFDLLTSGKKNIYVASYNSWNKYIISKDLAKVFIPACDLQKRINEITKDWGENVVGLHIRRTDNVGAIEKSPLTYFYDVIENEISNNKETRFYLATDDCGVKKELKDKYGARIITLDLALERNSVKGMKDAVVDLYCLGNTTKIYGSHHSTYSIIASQLYNIELIV